MDKRILNAIANLTPKERKKLEKMIAREERLKSSRSQTPTECCTAVSEANVQHDGNRRLVARSAAPQEPSVSGRKSGRQFQIFSEFLNTVKSGKQALMVGNDYVVMSRKMFNDLCKKNETKAR